MGAAPPPSVRLAVRLERYADGRILHRTKESRLGGAGACALLRECRMRNGLKFGCLAR